ncbi:Uncharacterised protein [Vibrio cholerae]|uniref:Uncharacterized protein n=1 Tax=Vibrio cholerae TaxID=666 RepID=A0A655ZH51_VIBCL|nr:Uncharacterised protein [Vibrio cholerae]CSC68031.1 Uncharacterised protein [Vibrio cholerae]
MRLSSTRAFQPFLSMPKRLAIKALSCKRPSTVIHKPWPSLKRYALMAH